MVQHRRVRVAMGAAVLSESFPRRFGGLQPFQTQFHVALGPTALSDSFPQIDLTFIEKLRFILSVSVHHFFTLLFLYLYSIFQCKI